jgi:hypothetical protein
MLEGKYEPSRLRGWRQRLEVGNGEGFSACRAGVDQYIGIDIVDSGLLHLDQSDMVTRARIVVVFRLALGPLVISKRGHSHLPDTCDPKRYQLGCQSGKPP